MTRRIVIYTRYSSEMQSPKSCKDQEREVREALTKMGIDHRLALVIHDEAESGTKTFRSEFERLETMLVNGEIGILAVDDQARLTRADNAFAFITDIVFSGGRWLSTGEGIDTTQPGWELRVKVMELHNSTTIRELGRRVRRGQAGRLLTGLTAGDYPYGYESFLVNPAQAADVSRNGPKPEKNLRINEDRARWIRQIFIWFLAAWSLTKIAEELNRLGVPLSKRYSKKKAWTHKHIRSILSNPKYIGKWIWGKTRTVRNSTGKTKQDPVPFDQWIRVEREDLRIIDQITWDKAQLRLMELQKIFGYKEGQKRRGPRVHHSLAYPSGLLNGLLFCSECGSRLHFHTSNSREYFSCPNAGDAPGMCGMRASVPLSKAKEAILSTVTPMLTGQPEWVTRTVAIMERRLTEVSSSVPRELEADRRRLADLESQIENLVDNMTRMVHSSPAMHERLAALEAQAAELRAAVEESANLLDVPLQLPSKDWVMEQLKDTHSILEEESRKSALLLRDLLGKVRVYQVLSPGKVRGFAQLRFRVNGLAALRAVLPADVFRATLGRFPQADGGTLEVGEEFCIDLGAATRMDEWAPQIAQWRAEKVTWKEICKRTGLGLGPAYVTWKRFVDSQKRAAGLDSPAPTDGTPPEEPDSDKAA